jgi:hypothetical protein
LPQPRFSLFFQLAHPLFIQGLVEFLQRDPAVPHNRNCDRYVLADRSGIDVNVDYMGLRCKGSNLPRDAIIEAHTDGNQEIAFGSGHVGGVGPMHTDHPQPERIRSRKGSKAHEARRDRGLNLSRKLPQLLGSPGEDDTSPGEDHRPFGFLDEFDRLGQLLHVGLIRRIVGFERDFFYGLVLGCSLHDVLGEVHEHGSGPSGSSDIKRLSQNSTEIFNVLDQVIVFGAGPGDSHNVHFLKSIVPDETGVHLPGEDHHGNRVHISRGNSRDGVGCTRSRGHQADADVACCASISVRGMNCALLVADHDVTDITHHQLIIDVDDGTSRIPENGIHPFFL